MLQSVPPVIRKFWPPVPNLPINDDIRGSGGVIRSLHGKQSNVPALENRGRCERDGIATSWS